MAKKSLILVTPDPAAQLWRAKLADRVFYDSGRSIEEAVANLLSGLRRINWTSDRSRFRVELV